MLVNQLLITKLIHTGYLRSCTYVQLDGLLLRYVEAHSHENNIGKMRINLAKFVVIPFTLPIDFLNGMQHYVCLCVFSLF